VKSDLLAKSPLLALPLIALVLFIVVFAAMFIVTMKRRAPAYDPLARMPLDDDDVAGARRGDDAQEGAPQ
jgi:hypothetical protein